MKCPRCSKEVTDGQRECPHCGIVFSKVKEPGSMPRTTHQPSQTSGAATRRPSAPLFSKGFLLVLAILAMGTGALAWYYFYGPCGTKRIERSIDELRVMAERWDDANSVAGSAVRIALAAPVAELQAIKQQVNQLAVPRCLLPSKRTLLSSMETSIEAYLAFMQKEDESVVRATMLRADVGLSRFRSQLEDVLVCAPFCPSKSE